MDIYARLVSLNTFPLNFNYVDQKIHFKIRKLDYIQVLSAVKQ